MKKFLALLLTLVLTMSSMVVMAAPGRPGKPDGNTPQSLTVTFYVSRWGTQLDKEGDIKTRDVGYFSNVVFSSKLKKKLNKSFTAVIGSTTTEADILSYVDKVPADGPVFDKIIGEFKNSGATLYTNKRKVISWDELNAENYGVIWYVLKNESDSWHIDGYIYDIDTNENVNVVLPDEEEDFLDYTDEEQQPEEDTSIHLEGAEYAYIFGYEPIITQKYDEATGITYTTAMIKMAMDDKVTREQVSSMLVRALDQAGYTSGKSFPMVEAVRSHQGQWYERGLLYLCSVGGFDSKEVIRTEPITRGEVAKLVACALKLNLSEETPFDDVDVSPYKGYIEKVYKYGYMNGVSDTSFEPNEVMTRAEFCSLFNNVLERNNYGLTALNADNEEYEITAEDYYFVDMDKNHWAYEICLKATSAYNDNGYVDVNTRNANIRNIIDMYDAQKEY